MADLYRVVGTDNPNDDWTSEVILARDKKRNPSKVISATVAAELNKSDLETLKKLGVKVEKVSAAKARDLAEGEEVGADVASAAPLLGDEE